MAIKLSVIIVNYKSKKYLKKCLRSLNQFLAFSHEIIVVNNSIDESLSAIKGVIIVDSGGNVGFSKANNLGAKRARGNILLFLNPDTIGLSDFTSVFTFFKNKNIGVVGGYLHTEQNIPQKYAFGKKYSLSNLVLSKFYPSSLQLSGTSVDWVSGACLFIRPNLFKKLRGFDDQFFMYFEDQDLCIRAKKLGYTVAVDTDFKVLHYKGKSSKTSAEVKKIYYTSQDYFFQKHYGWLYAVFVKLFRFIGEGLHLTSQYV